MDTGERDTCTDVAPRGARYFECSVCHCRFDVENEEYSEPTTWLADGTGTLPRFCPCCGRLVRWLSDED